MLFNQFIKKINNVYTTYSIFFKQYFCKIIINSIYTYSFMICWKQKLISNIYLKYIIDKYNNKENPILIEFIKNSKVIQSLTTTNIYKPLNELFINTEKNKSNIFIISLEYDFYIISPILISTNLIDKNKKCIITKQNTVQIFNSINETSVNNEKNQLIGLHLYLYGCQKYISIPFNPWIITQLYINNDEPVQIQLYTTEYNFIISKNIFSTNFFKYFMKKYYNIILPNILQKLLLETMNQHDFNIILYDFTEPKNTYILEENGSFTLQSSIIT